MARSASERHLLRALAGGGRARWRPWKARWARLRGQTLLPVHPRIERYLEDLAPLPDDPARHAMERLADEQGFPIVGPLVGRFLELQARSAGATRVFEFGSGFGYSAFWFARAVGAGGEVICSDGDPANRTAALRHLAQAGLDDRVTFHVGHAQRVFADIEGTFDVCYNDVDKPDYPEVWRLARERVRPGGLYIADNALWFGKVALRGVEDFSPGSVEGIREHNRAVFADPAFDAFIHPVRDGVLVARRR